MDEDVCNKRPKSPSGVDYGDVVLENDSEFEGKILDEQYDEPKEVCRPEPEKPPPPLPPPPDKATPPDKPPLALLPPDHPLMVRFQQMLKDLLLRSKDKLIDELDEAKYQFKLAETQREEVGAKLFDMQHDIRLQNQQIETYAADIQRHVDERKEEEEKVDKLTIEFKDKMKMSQLQKQIYKKRMAELEDMQALENNMRRWVDDVEDEVKNAKRIVSRDAQLQQQLSENKKKSDMLFFHLDMEVRRREQELAACQDELTGMRKITDALNMSIANANADLDIIQSEHKRLSAAWYEVIIAISHRDKIMFQLNEAIEKEKEFIKLAKSSIQAVKKQVEKELKQNEKLKAFKTRLSDDFLALKKECHKETINLTRLENKLLELPLFLEHTNRDLQEAVQEGNTLELELRRILWRVDKKNKEKYNLEEAILKMAQDLLITDKASEYRLKLLQTAQEQRRTLELKLAKSQNTLAETLLEVETLSGTLINLRNQNTDEKNQLASCEHTADNVSVELKNMETQIDLKLKRLDRLTRRLDELNQSAESLGVNPTEYKIKMVEKAIQKAEQQIREHQHFWLMLQNHFVNLSQKRNNQLNEIQVTRKQLSIIQQKSLKIDFDLEKCEATTHELRRDIQIYTTKVELLNVKMFEKRKQHESEEGDCELEHADLLEKLKDHEMEILQLEENINDIQGEIDQLKDVVLDKHRESLSWETKYKLIEETIRWRRDEGSLNSEINSMKSEIHRMSLRHKQLKKAQEKLMTDLEHCIMHREQIFVTSFIKQRMESKQKNAVKSSQLKQRINDLRNKLKQIQMETDDLNSKIPLASCENERLSNEIHRLRLELEKDAIRDEKMKNDIEEAILQKQNNIEVIVRKQNRAKAYQKFTSGTANIPKLSATDSSLQLQIEKQVEINENLVEITQILSVEMPEKRPTLNRIYQVLKE